VRELDRERAAGARTREKRESTRRGEQQAAVLRASAGRNCRQMRMRAVPRCPLRGRAGVRALAAERAHCGPSRAPNLVQSWSLSALLPRLLTALSVPFLAQSHSKALLFGPGLSPTLRERLEGDDRRNVHSQPASPDSRPRQSRPAPHDPRRLARPASALFSCELSSLCSIDCPRARRGQGTPGARFMVRALAESRGHVAAAPPHQLPRSRPTEVEIDTVSALLEPNVRVQPACAGPARWRCARPAPFDFCMSRAGARVHSEAE